MPRGNTRANEINKEVGAKIHTARVRAGKSRQDVANYIGISHQQLEKNERGKNQTSVARLFLIAEYLGVSIDSLIEDVETPNRNAPPTHSRLVMEAARNFGLIKSDTNKYAANQILRNLAAAE